MNNLEGRKHLSRLSGREKEGEREARAAWELITGAGPTAGEKDCVLPRSHPISITYAGHSGPSAHTVCLLHTGGLCD